MIRPRVLGIVRRGKKGGVWLRPQLFEKGRKKIKKKPDYSSRLVKKSGRRGKKKLSLGDLQFSHEEPQGAGSLHGEKRGKVPPRQSRGGGGGKKQGEAPAHAGAHANHGI